MSSISIKNARVNNLQNINIDIPLNKITCFVGPSGSGKSSLAFHTLYNESKRRFINSFPTSMKFFLDPPPPVDVDLIEPVLPVFSLAQINPVIGSREAVIDVLKMTEILQKVYYNFSEIRCPEHGLPLEEKTLQGFIENNTKEGEAVYLFLEREEFLDFYGEDFFPSYSYQRKINDFKPEDKYWMLTRFKNKKGQVSKKLEEFKHKNFNTIYIKSESTKLLKFNHSTKKKCPKCDYEGFASISPHYFSPYNSLGACNTCKGFGHILDYDPEKMLHDNKTIEEGVKVLNFKPLRAGLTKYLKDVKRLKIKATDKIAPHRKELENLLYNGGKDFEGVDKYTNYLERKKYKRSVRIFNRTIQSEYLCEVCHGSRVKDKINNSFIEQSSYLDLTTVSIRESLEALKKIKSSDKALKKSVMKLIDLLSIAANIGLGHLNLQRKVKSLSSSEYQRLLLIKYLSFEGTNSLFIFDEPTLGLGKTEIAEIFKAINRLIEQSNTVILVDHNEEVIKKSDHIIGLGPNSGPKGGSITYEGKPIDYINKHLKKFDSKNLVQSPSDQLKLTNIEIGDNKIPNQNISLGAINLVYGDSGSGKSTLFQKVLPTVLEGGKSKDGKLKLNKKNIVDDVILFEQTFSNNSRSTFGSVSGLSPVLRDHFAKQTFSKQLGYASGHFSSNSDLGRCSFCEGRGYQIIEMQYMEDIKITCEYCNGKKLKPYIANLSDGNFTVYEAFNTPVSRLFEDIRLTPKFQRMLVNIEALNLDYLNLDREVSTLSGGERQRLNLLARLSKKIDNSLIVLKNISFGLSSPDQWKILQLLDSLCLKGNTIILLDQSMYFQQVIAKKYHINLKV